jgi:hypothetical protein
VLLPEAHSEIRCHLAEVALAKLCVHAPLEIGASQIHIHTRTYPIEALVHPTDFAWPDWQASGSGSNERASLNDIRTQTGIHGYQSSSIAEHKTSQKEKNKTQESNSIFIHPSSTSSPPKTPIFRNSSRISLVLSNPPFGKKIIPKLPLEPSPNQP